MHQVLDIAHILHNLHGSNVIENQAIEQTYKQKKSEDFARILQSLDCSNIFENRATEQTSRIGFIQALAEIACNAQLKTEQLSKQISKRNQEILLVIYKATDF